MTNHERILEEREKAAKNKPVLLKAKRLRQKRKKQKTYWKEGNNLKPKTKPTTVLYFPWIKVYSTPEEGKEPKLLGFAKQADPIVQEFQSRKDYRS